MKKLGSVAAFVTLARLVAAFSPGGEVIVVSDGSSDRTVESAREAARQAEAGGAVTGQGATSGYEHGQGPLL